MLSMDRRVAHLDMDAFYASVELLRYPQLKGLPVVIGGRRSREAPSGEAEEFGRLRDYVGRGVATTATYEARTLGVRSGMGLMKAAALAPDAILLPADFEEYGRYSRKFKAAVADIAPCIEDRGIDEIYIDLTELPDETIALAQRIKENVRRATGLASSIGVAPNKLLAKLASELQKPNGLTVLTYADLAARIWPLPARRINGIGPKANTRLEALGIRTIGDLAHATVEMLSEHFGERTARWLVDVSHGRDESPIVTEFEPKSISRETTFERDLDARADREALTEILVSLCAHLASDLERKGYVGKTIGVKLRYSNFRTVTRDTTLEHPTNDPRTICSAARSCLKRVVFDRKLRLLGVRVGSLVRTGRVGDESPPDEVNAERSEADASSRAFD
jgi:DNA polymerase-4